METAIDVERLEPIEANHLCELLELVVVDERPTQHEILNGKGTVISIAVVAVMEKAVQIGAACRSGVILFGRELLMWNSKFEAIAEIEFLQSEH